jgi:hypothetical protein
MMEYNAPELRPGWTYLGNHLAPTPEIVAAENAAYAAWEMHTQAINDKMDNHPTIYVVDGIHVTPRVHTWDEITKLGDEAVECDQTCRRMWQELYDKKGIQNG